MFHRGDEVEDLRSTNCANAPKGGEPTSIFDAGWPSSFSCIAEIGEALSVHILKYHSVCGMMVLSLSGDDGFAKRYMTLANGKNRVRQRLQLNCNGMISPMSDDVKREAFLLITTAGMI